MNKINPLLEAINDIDDSIITNAAKTPKRPIALMIAAAAAAALLVTGFAAAFRSGVRINGKEAFDYDLTVQEMTIPEKEELTALGAVDTQKSEYSFDWETLPSELWNTFGISPLMNGSFTGEKCGTSVWVDFTNGVPTSASFDYELTDNKRGLPVEVSIYCLLKEGAGLRSDYEEDVGETVTLNDGSKALIYDVYLGGYEKYKAYADFSYGGIVYTLSAWTDKQGMTDILSDFGVL